MDAVSFLNQPLLWGVGLASIPIIIHLLFRRRFRLIEWAPMKYLKLSIRRNRRRIRIEQLLLLLLRVAIIAMLFMAVARPVMHAQGLGSWLGGRSRTNQMLVIDDSLSTGYQVRGRSALDRAKELTLEILKTIGPKDRFTLITTSRPQSPLLNEVELTDSALVEKLVRELKVSDVYTAWDSVLPAIDDLLRAGTYPIQEVTIITDMRRAGWDEKAREAANRFRSQHVHVRVFDVGNDVTDNVAVTALEPVERIALVSAPVVYEATIQNQSTRDIEGLEATFAVDGKPGLVRLPAIGRGQTAKIPLSATFQEAGLHHVSFKLPADALPGDDARYLVTEVHQKLRMTLIDGEPSTDPLAGEVDFLALALSLGTSEADSWQIDLLTDSEWATATAAQPDLMVIANVARLTSQQVAELERFVRAGMGLMIFLGEQVEPDNYNSLLYKDGRGLLPVPLEAIGEEKIDGLALEDVPRSPLAALKQLSPAVMQRIAVRKFMQVQLPRGLGKGVRLLARWNSTGTAPAAIDRTFGRGDVLLWTITADKAWSDWPTDPSYVLAMREAAKAIVRGDSIPRDLVAGEPLKLERAAGREATSPRIETPGAKESVPMQIDNGPAADKQPDQRAPTAASTPIKTQTIRFDDTRLAGVYRVTWQERQKGSQSELYAVDPDRRESDLPRIETDELRSLLGGLKLEVIPAFEGRDVPIAVRGREIWRTLATSLFVMLLFEAGFATWTGRQH